MKSFFLSVVLCLLGALSAVGQFHVRGEVQDARGLAIPMVYVERVGSDVATSTNVHGVFSLVVEAGDSLRFSHLGFGAEVRLAEECLFEPVVLHPQVESLATATVVGLKAETVLDRCLENLPQNHQNNPGHRTGFYRLTGMQGERPLQISEAVLTTSPGQDLPAIVRTRSIRDEGQLGELTFGVTPRSVRDFDRALFPESFPPFQRKLRKHHTYWLSDTLEIIDDRPAYRLYFDAAPNAKKPAWKGVAYIDAETFALVYVESDFSPSTTHLLKFGDAGTRSALAILGLKINQHSDRTRVQYQRQSDGVWRLITARNDTVLEVFNKRDQSTFSPTFRTDYVVTGRSPQALETTKVGAQGMIETTRADASPEFWKGYTATVPDRDYVSIAQELEKRNAHHAIEKRLQQARESWPTDRMAQVDSCLAWFEREAGFEGLILVAQKDSVLRKFATEGISSDTAFAIGSIAKSFTALWILRLEELGKLKMNDRVGMYLGDEVEADSPLRSLTFRQLLTHRAGLDHGLDHPEILLSLAKAGSRWEQVAAVCGTPIYAPDSTFRYSNGGYMLAAYAAEQAAGVSWSKGIEQEFLEWLNMTGTAFPDSIQTSDPNPMYNPAWAQGAGGMRSTLDDLHTWGLQIRNTRTPDYVQEAWFYADSMKYRVGPSARSLVQATTVVSEYIDWQAGYGMGWMEDRGAFSVSNTHRILYHPGTEWNTETMLAVQPDEGIVVVLVSLNGPFARYPMTEILLEGLLGN